MPDFLGSLKQNFWKGTKLGKGLEHKPYEK